MSTFNFNDLESFDLSNHPDLTRYRDAIGYDKWGAIVNRYARELEAKASDIRENVEISAPEKIEELRQLNEEILVQVQSEIKKHQATLNEVTDSLSEKTADTLDQARDFAIEVGVGGGRLSEARQDVVAQMIDDARGTIKILRYPQDLETVGNRHWIQFNIYDTAQSYLQKEVSTYLENASNELINNLDEDTRRRLLSGQVDVSDPKEALIYLGAMGKDALENIGVNFQELVRGDMIDPIYNLPGNNLSASDRGRTTRQETGAVGRKIKLNQSVCLYMPDNIGTTYGFDYEDEDLSTGSAIRRLVGGTGQAISNRRLTNDQARFAQELVEERIIRGIPNLIDSITNLAPEILPNINAGGTIRALTRKVSNPHMELLFRGTNRRTFQFSFDFTPRNYKEAMEVQKIIHIFKYYAHPKLSNAMRFQYFPAEFDISYYSDSAINQYLSRIGTCALTNIAVNYAGSGQFVTFENDGKGSFPAHIKLDLEFSELEILHRDRIGHPFKESENHGDEGGF